MFLNITAMNNMKLPMIPLYDSAYIEIKKDVHDSWNKLVLIKKIIFKNINLSISNL